MEYNGNATGQDIVSEVLKITGGTLNTYPLNDITRRVNNALDRFYSIALRFSGDWQFDDSNYTDLPLGVANLVSGQIDYSFASDVLFVTKVLVKDSSGNFSEIPQVDQDDESARSIYLSQSTNTGTPTRYDIIANSIILDPVPNYNSTGGLKVIFQRNASKFATTDTTKQPGIPSLFHLYLARHASLPFLVEKTLPQAAGIAGLIAQDEVAIQDFIGTRNRVGTRRRGMRVNYQNNQ